MGRGRAGGTLGRRERQIGRGIGSGPRPGPSSELLLLLLLELLLLVRKGVTGGLPGARTSSGGTVGPAGARLEARQ
jgi:hypothetical protein